MTLEDAKKRIKELEKEIEDLKAENEILRNRTMGRKKHDHIWMASYNEFATKFESGMSIMEIVASSDFSRRTAYRYKAYYDELHDKLN